MKFEHMVWLILFLEIIFTIDLFSCIQSVSTNLFILNGILHFLLSLILSEFSVEGPILKKNSYWNI